MATKIMYNFFGVRIPCTEALNSLNSFLISNSVYEDVEEALKLWTSSGKQVYIYSSGSVEAQRLLFKHSVAGNLLQVLIIPHYSEFK